MLYLDMSFLIDRLQFLGLNEREIRVFTSLATFGRMNMTKLASRSSLPRTTVDAIVRRLQKQGLVSQERVRGHYEYFVNADDIANSLDWMEKRFRTDTKEGHKSDENIVKETKKLEIPKDITSKYAGDRVKVLLSRGYEDMEECVRRFVKYLKVSIENNYKLEVLLSASIADALMGRKDIPLPPSGEAVRLNVVPTLYSTGMHDMFIFRDSVLLVNTNSKMQEHIEHMTVVDMSRHLIEIACETGWSVDLIAWLNKTE